MKRFYFILLTISCFFYTSLWSQSFTRDNYLDFMPSARSIFKQTGASEQTRLYGDKGENDLTPVDGIEDRRGARLDTLAAIFSPVLYKNNFSIPLNFEIFLRENLSPFLYVDSWELSGPQARRIPAACDSINLALLNRNDALLSPEALLQKQKEDQKLKQLLEEFHPTRKIERQIRPETQLRKVLYIDFPGQDEESWKTFYQKFEESRESTIYAHPFVREDTSASGQARYDLVIQYWFFYPFNDGGNNHEGDWEHINVHITTRQIKEGLLSREDIVKILIPGNQTILESLMIKKVDYYFHHFVMTLDYQALDFLQDETGFRETLSGHQEEKLLQKWLYEQIYRRIHLEQQQINTHPIAYIGADNMGLDQILSWPGDKNRNSHGTFPFPGIWRDVGPLGATEKIRGEKDYRFILPPISPTKLPVGITVLPNPRYKPEKNPQVLTYTTESLKLLPDWERVQELVLNDPVARRKWFWLMLPIRWGFPAVESPGAGLIEHTDLGNIAPVGPAYNTGWNRAGPSQGYDDYEPHILPSQFQTGIQDNFSNSLGFLNLFLRAPLSLPVINLIWYYTGARLQFNPKFYPRDKLPFRFGSLVYHPFYAFGNNKFANLLPQAEDPQIAAFLQANPGTQVAESTFEQDNKFSFVGFMVNLNIGSRWATEHSFTSVNSTVRYRLQDSANQNAGTVEGTSKLREFTGSLRFSVLTEGFQPFLIAGYGWSWYKVSGVTLNGEALANPQSEWYHNPKFPYLPNTWHVGAGVELFLLRNRGLWRVPLLHKLFTLGKPDLGLRVDYMLKIHGLGSDVPNDRGKTTIYRHEIGFGFVIGF